MRKGQTKRVWTPEQKSGIVHKYLDDHISVRTLERKYTADRSMTCRWVKEYIAEGETAFISTPKESTSHLNPPDEVPQFIQTVQKHPV